MYLPLEHRVEVLLDDEPYRRISAIARERGVSVATVIREAIDCGVNEAPGRRQSAIKRLLDAPDIPVPDIMELHEELDEWRGRRDVKLNDA